MLKSADQLANFPHVLNNNIVVIIIFFKFLPWKQKKAQLITYKLSI